MKHKEQSEYVDRTQRQYETALTRALAKNKKNTRPLQHKFKLSAILCLKQATVGKVTIGSDETIIISNVYQLGQNVVKYIVHAANT